MIIREEIILRKAALLFIVLLLGACGQMNESQENDRQSPLQNTRTEVNNENNQRNSDERRADYLAGLASDIPHVKNATAVVAGDYAIIGIDIDKDLDRSKVGSIKYSVTESIKHDPQGAGAIVVADPDLNARLNEIREDMSAGKPIQGIINELADITGRVMPELPPQEDNKNPQDAPKEQKREMDRPEGQRMQKEQEKQSTE